MRSVLQLEGHNYISVSQNANLQLSSTRSCVNFSGW